jgi:hypothetical protein
MSGAPAIHARDAGSETTVALLAAGSEPRRALRMHPTMGARSAVRLMIGIPEVETKVGDRVERKQKYPTQTMVLETDVAEVEHDGDYRYVLSWSDVRVEESPDLSRDFQAQMARRYAELAGTKGTVRASSRGFEIENSLEPNPEPGTPLSAARNVRQALRQLAVPLPDEPVGVGARWSANTTLNTDLVELRQAANYELEALDGDHCRIRASFEQTSSKPPTSNVPSTKATGSGRIVLDLTHPVPDAATVDWIAVTEYTNDQMASITTMKMTTKLSAP